MKENDEHKMWAHTTTQTQATVKWTQIENSGARKQVVNVDSLTVINVDEEGQVGGVVRGQRSAAQSSDLPYLFWRRSAHVLHNYARHLERQCSFNEPHCDGGSDRQNRHHGNTFKYVRPFRQSGWKGQE